jgi:DUF4097 and DUF4098 domain-containing protein YvlB
MNNFRSGDMKSTALRLLAAWLVLTCFAFARSNVQGTFERTYQVSGPADLQVFTHSGDIVVHSGPAGSVKVSGKIIVSDRWLNGGKTSDVQELEKNPPVRQDANNIRIDYVNIRNIAIDYEITVPAETKVQTHTGSGDQTMEGLKSALELESGSGDIQLRDLEGPVQLHTGSGDVKGDVAAAFRAETGSGDIRIEERGAGDIDVHTGSGNIEVRGVNGALRAQAGSGDLTIEGIQKNNWEVHTGSGNVNLRLPANAAFNLEARTSSGDVVVDHPVSMTVQGKVQEEHKSVVGTVGGGGPLLSVHTGSGDIHIE